MTARHLLRIPVPRHIWLPQKKIRQNYRIQEYKLPYETVEPLRKKGDWHGYQKHNGKLNHVKLYDMAVIPGLHKIFFNITQALQKGFQVISEGEALILKKK